jgi:hypothetical protein
MSLIHFKYLNQIEGSTIYRYSSQLDTLPASNVQNDIVKKVWRTDSNFIMTTYNREVVFRDTSSGAVKHFAIPSATYAGSSLASVLQSQMNATGTFNDHVVTFNSATGKWILRRTGGTGIFQLLWNNATYKANTPSVILGFNHATDYTGSKTYSATSFGNEHELILQFTSTQSVNSFIIDGHNWATGTIIRLRTTKSTASVFSGGWNANAAITKSSTIAYCSNMISVEFTATSVKSMQLYWYDRSQACSQIGKLFAGTFFCPQYSRSSDQIWRSKKPDTRTDKQISQGGVTFFNKKSTIWEYEIGIDPMDPYFNSATKTGYENMFEYVSDSKCFYLSLDSSLNSLTIFGYLKQAPTYKRKQNTPIIDAGPITFREQK